MAGIEVVVLGSRMNETYKSKQGKVSIQPDGTTEALASEFDAIVIPSGMAPDKMRINTVGFVQEAMEQGKLVAAVGPQVLIEAICSRVSKLRASSPSART